MISLPRLVSTCADAARRGCLVIRSVQSRREAVLASASAAAASSTSDDAFTTTANSSSHDAAAAALREASSHGIKYKVDGDPRSALTEADGAAQRVVMECLRTVWGDELQIIGEEDDEEEGGDAGADDIMEVFGRYNVPTPSDSPIQQDLFSSTEYEVPLSSVCLYLDPLDGTREFVEGRLGNCQCLVGIAVDGIPVGGVVGIPFPDGRTEALEGKRASELGDVQVVYSMLGVEETLLETNGDAADEPGATKKHLIVLSGDSKKPEKDLAMKHLNDMCSAEGYELDVRVAGGCGNKMMQVALAAAAASETNAIAVIPRGTCSWDTAAPTAVLNAALDTSSAYECGSSGLVTDMYGDPLEYDGINITNKYGALASCGEKGEVWHTELCSRLQTDQAVGIKEL